MTIQCCVCKKVKQENDWVGKPLQATLDVSHSYCPVCLEASRVMIAKEMATRPPRHHSLTLA